MAAIPDAVAAGPASQGDGISTTKIADWTSEYGLTADEVARLESVLSDYPADEVASELEEELRCVFGARKLATMPEMSTEDFLAVGRRFKAGLTPFTPQDVD